MGFFITFCVLLVIFLGMIVFNPLGQTLADDLDAPPNLPRVLGAVLFAIAGIVMLASCFATVDAKNVGVVTQFGRTVDTASPGLTFKAPWQDVTEIDGTKQTNEYRDDGKDDGCGGAIYVRIGDGSQSCLTATIRWQIVPEKADVIFADYRSDDPAETFRKNVISTQFKAAAQAVMAEYNPIATLEVVDGANAGTAADLNFAPDYDRVSADLLAQMQDRLGEDPLAIVESVTVSYVSLAGSTQEKLNDFIKAVAETRIAAQNVNTANEQARANEVIAASLEASTTEGVLVSRCLDALTVAIEKGYGLPAGFNCLGSGSAVVVPASK